MPPKYKIFYTDGSKLLWSDIAPNGDPRLIPPAKRIGVHSVIQEIDNNSVREVVEQYHYVFQISTQRWVGLGLDGLIDWTANLFEDIRCIMHGRTGATDVNFWNIKQGARSDPDIIGSVSAEEAARTRYSAIPGSDKLQFAASTDSSWTGMARHRMYDERFAERPVYGHQEHYHQ